MALQADMLDSTVFVIGAGASSEADLPMASGLVDAISRKLSFEMHNGQLRDRPGDPEILGALHIIRQSGVDLNALLRAAWSVKDGARYANSIDTFMDNHAEDNNVQICAKLGIVKSIIEAENGSALYADSGKLRFRDESKILLSWYGTLFRHLSDGVRKCLSVNILNRMNHL